MYGPVSLTDNLNYCSYGPASVTVACAMRGPASLTENDSSERPASLTVASAMYGPASVTVASAMYGPGSVTAARETVGVKAASGDYFYMAEGGQGGAEHTRT
jgi:hypothetical protein